MTAPLAIQRIVVNQEGYDSHGVFWGAGDDVFIATTPGGEDEVTVRAGQEDEARSKIAEILNRAAGDPSKKPREPLGGKSHHISRHEINWTHPVSHARVRIRVTHARDQFMNGNDHLAIESLAPARTPLPFTETGYRSHFMAAQDLHAAGGPVAFVTAWLAHDAKTKSWLSEATKAAQGDLFGWADAQQHVTPRQPPAAAKPPAGKSTRTRARARTPE